MKPDRFLWLFLALLSAVFAAGLYAREAQADDPTPKEVCLAAIEDLVEDGIDLGSFWEDDLEECWIRTDVAGSSCYPGYEVWGVVWAGAPGSSDWEWIGYGCVGRYNRPTDVIKDPSFGFHVVNSEGGGTFTYQPRTCVGLCRIRAHGLTIRARESLPEAPGKVIGKAYIQIFDQFGDLGYGDFTYCLPARSARDPVFFRLGAGRQWYPILGGHWEINLYCFNGEMSGNYILVDMALKPD